MTEVGVDTSRGFCLEIADKKLLMGPTIELPRPHIRVHLKIRGDIQQSTATRIVAEFLQNEAFLDTPQEAIHSLASSPTPWALFAAICAALQRAAGAEALQHSAFDMQTPDEGVACIEWEDADTAEEAADLAFAVLSSALQFQIPQESIWSRIAAFLGRQTEWSMDPNSRLLLQAARDAGLCALNLSQAPFSAPRASAYIRNGFLQIGAGSGQRRFLSSAESTPPSSTSPFPRSRQEFALKLSSAGIFVPANVGNLSSAGSASQAASVAASVGYPVVLRPANAKPFSDSQTESRVIGPLSSERQLIQAFDSAFGQHREAWVERYVNGPVWRVIVLDGQPVAAFELQSPTITGDGASTIRELLGKQVAAAATGRQRRAWQSLAQSDRVALRLTLEELALDAVPTAGQIVTLDCPRASFAGADTQWQGSLLPRSVEQVAIRAAAAVCGPLVAVDIVSTRDDTILVDDWPVAVSVNPEPDITVRHSGGPTNGSEIARRLIGLTPPRTVPAQPPIVAVTGSSGKTTTTIMIRSIFRRAGLQTGSATSLGYFVNEECLQQGDLAGLLGSYPILARPDVQAFALESARGGMITIGRGFNHCDVGICLNICEDHIGESGIRSIEDLVAVKGEVIRHARRAAVLNADDPNCLAMAEKVSPHARVILFSATGTSAELQMHRAAGGTAVLVVLGPDGQEWIALSHGGRDQFVARVRELPVLYGGTAVFNLANAMAAIATCDVLGIPLSAITEALRDLKPDHDTLPARLNEVPSLPFRLILDAAKNRNSFEALARFAERQSITGKRIVAFGIWPGTQGRYVEAMTRAAASAFDHFLLKPYRQKYGVAAGPEPFDLIKETLLAAGVPSASIETFDKSADAIHRVMSLAQPGDLAVVVSAPTRVAEEGHWEVIQELAHGVRKAHAIQNP